MAQAPSPPSIVDTPALRFLQRGRQLSRLEQRVLAQVRSEHEQERGTWDDLDVSTSKDVEEFVKSVKSGLGAMQTRLSDVNLMIQLFYSRNVDNFQIFLEELLEAIFSAQPGLLKRGEPVQLEEIFSHPDMESFRRAVLERRIRSLAYKSIEDLLQILKKEFNFDLFPQSAARASIVQMFDRRNLITHNYGLVNRWFLSKYPESSLQIGQEFPYTPEGIVSDLRILAQASVDIEKRAKQKFRLFQP